MEAHVMYEHLSEKAHRSERRKLQNRLNQRASRRRRKPPPGDVAAGTGTQRASRVCDSNQNRDEIHPDRRHSTMALVVPGSAIHTRDAHDDCGLLNPLQSLRKDPFDCLPIQSRPYLPRVIDFFFDLFGSPYVYRPELVNVKQPRQFQEQYFQFAMQHQVLFHSIVTLTLACLQAMSEPQALVPTKDVLFHHTHALNGLRQKLSSPREVADDSVLLSILTLLGIDYLYGNTEAFGVHLAGLQQTLDMRGGARTSPWLLFIQSRTLTYNSLWAQSMSQRQRIQSLNTPTYPKHPFDQHLCKDITDLPVGFQELCLRGYLSLQMIDILSHTHAWTLEMKSSADQTIGPSHSNTMEPGICAKLLQSSALRPLEQFLCVAVMAYHLDAFCKKPLQPLTWFGLQRPTLPNPAYPSGDVEVDYCLLWIAVVLEMTKDSSVSTLFDRYRRQWNLLDKIFDHEPCARSWSWVRNHLDFFFGVLSLLRVLRHLGSMPCWTGSVKRLLAV